MLRLMRKWEQHKTNKWVRSSAYAYVAGVLTCLWLCYACAFAYVLVRTSFTLKGEVIQHCSDHNNDEGIRQGGAKSQEQTRKLRFSNPTSAYKVCYWEMASLNNTPRAPFPNSGW